MGKSAEFEKQGSLQGPLYEVGLTIGVYEPVNLQGVTEVLGSWVVRDPKGLLNRVITPDSMSPTDHAYLLRVLIGKGYKNADDEFAVGPVLDQDLNPLPNKMRVVHFESVRQQI